MEVTMGLRALHVKDQRSYQSRQKALDSLQETCARERICDSCVCSAAAYLVALAAHGLGWDRDRLLGFVAAVWEDLEHQRVGDGGN
jgi:hypothetical protein